MKAFPVVVPDVDENYSIQSGMDLRDYFAAMALQYFLSSYVDDDLGIDRVAVLSYAAADAMMKAREK